MKQLQLILFMLVVCGCNFKPSAQLTYDARIGDNEILTPKAGDAPRINGPKVYGARAAKKFIYRIPCQGKRPILFQINGLPEGMFLDTENGVISGVTPNEIGVYSMNLISKNNYGTDERTFKLIVGDKMALTPPTGWNTWGGHMIKVSDKLMRKAADIFVDEGFADVGYQYISIDDCWMKIKPEVLDSFTEKQKNKYDGFDYNGIVGNVRDADGKILPNIHFPDMKAMTDYIHSKGLKAGIYSGPGTQTCQKFEACKNHEEQDAKQYAAWGFDLLKYDLCSGGKDLSAKQDADSTYSQERYWKPMADYIQATDRDILFNLCQYGKEKPWEWAPKLGIQSWRTGGDLNHHVDTYFDQALRLATELRDFSVPGHWNDPDFLYIHKIRDHTKMANPTKEIPLNTNERYQYATLWSIINAPYFFSCNIEEMNEFTIRLLTNADVLNINQDAKGKVGKVLFNENDKVIILKDLEDGAKAVAIFNRNDEREGRYTLNWNELDLCCEQQVYDVWRQKDLGIYKGGIEVQLSANGVAYFILDAN